MRTALALLFVLLTASSAAAQYCPGCGRDYPKPITTGCPAGRLC